MVLSYIYVMYFSINLCGVEDSMENYQTYLIPYSAVMVFESYGMLSFFCFVTHISISLMIFMLNYAFTRILFSLRIHLLAVEMSDRQAFRSQVKLLSRTLYRIRVAAHVILKVREEDAVSDDYLHYYQIIEKEPASQPAYQTKQYRASKLTRRMQSLRLGSHEETGWSLATLTSMKDV